MFRIRFTLFLSIMISINAYAERCSIDGDDNVVQNLSCEFYDPERDQDLNIKIKCSDLGNYLLGIKFSNGFGYDYQNAKTNLIIDPVTEEEAIQFYSLGVSVLVDVSSKQRIVRKMNAVYSKKVDGVSVTFNGECR
jgi:hypothetical protein